MSTAWLFPGQGTQSVGMGRALYDVYASAREVFERADRALGWSMTKLCFEGPEQELTLTANAQPAILTVSLAALAALRESWPELPEPSFAAGHSLGEYSALVAAGALELEDALRIVNRRGRAMQEAVPEGQGAMAAIMGGDAELVARLCDEARDGEVLSAANYNAPGQIVIAGHAGAVHRASARAGAHKLKAIPLKVSAPFHCALMAPAAKVVAEALAGIAVKSPRFAVVSNVDALPNRDGARIAGLLMHQVDSPVRFEQSIRNMADAGVTRALEIGPGKVLAGLVKRIDKRITVHSISAEDGVAATRAFLG